MVSADFCSDKIPPWFDTSKFTKWLVSVGVSFSYGGQHNRTDGGEHYVLRFGDKQYDLMANCWDYRSDGWAEGIEWVERMKREVN